VIQESYILYPMHDNQAFTRKWDLRSSGMLRSMVL